MKTVAFVPIRLNSQRVAGKNLRPLDGSPLMCHILKTLTEVEGIDEVYVFCSDEGIRALLPEGVRLLLRDPSLDSDTTLGREIYDSFTARVGADLYILAHATSPFIRAATLADALGKVRSGEYDSAFSAEKIQTFAWFEGRPLNYALDNIPRTDHRAGLHRDQRLLHLFAGVVVRPRPPHRRSSLHGRRGPHRGFGHRLPRGLRHGRNHRGEPEPAGINKSRFCELADSEDFRFAGGESAGRSSALRKPAIPHAP